MTRKVIIKTSATASATVYHEMDGDGRTVCGQEGGNRVVPIDLAKEIASTGRLCMNCSGESNSGTTYPEKDCPICGTTVRSLAKHLPECPQRENVGGVAGP